MIDASNVYIKIKTSYVFIYLKIFFIFFKTNICESSTDEIDILTEITVLKRELSSLKHFDINKFKFSEIMGMSLNPRTKKTIIPNFYEEFGKKYKLSGPYFFLVLEPFFSSVDLIRRVFYQIIDSFFHAGSFHQKLYYLTIEKIFDDILTVFFASDFGINLIFLMIEEKFPLEFRKFLKIMNIGGQDINIEQWSCNVFCGLNFFEIRAVCLDLFLLNVDPKYTSRIETLNKINFLIEQILEISEKNKITFEKKNNKKFFLSEKKEMQNKDILNTLFLLELRKQKTFVEIFSSFENYKKSKRLNIQEVEKDFSQGIFSIYGEYYIFEEKNLPAMENIFDVEQIILNKTTTFGLICVTPEVEEFILNNESGKKSFENYEVEIIEGNIFFLEKQKIFEEEYTFVYIIEDYKKAKELGSRNPEYFFEKKNAEIEDFIELVFLYSSGKSTIKLPSLIVTVPLMRAGSIDPLSASADFDFKNNNFSVTTKTISYNFSDVNDYGPPTINFFFQIFKKLFFFRN